MAANEPEAFNAYNTNGTAPCINGTSANFFGSHKTDVYSDVISYTAIIAQGSMVLQASAAAIVKSFSNMGNDQFAIFATDDTAKYKGDEFGFVLPEPGTTWYAYCQSPRLSGWFVWKPVLSLGSSGLVPHDFKAVYSDAGSVSYVDFYVDGKLVWAAPYPNVTGQSFHMALCSHKVSDESVNTSQNTLQIESASLAGNAENNAQVFPYSSLL